MMSDLINRQDAIDEVINLWADKPFGNPTLVEIKDCIEALPSAERKRGIWMPIERGDKGYSAGDFICSCCGKPNNCYTITDYCCSCGAEMEHD